MNAPNPGKSSTSCSTNTRGAGTVETCFHQSTLSKYQPPATGCVDVRTEPVTAYPTMGGRSGKRHLIDPAANPSLRGRTCSRSIALEIVQVSNALSAAKSFSASADVNTFA